LKVQALTKNAVAGSVEVWGFEGWILGLGLTPENMRVVKRVDRTVKR